MATAPTAMKGLPPELISALMANSRTRNAYGPKLIEFAESDEAAINPAEVWPTELGNKKVATLYQGFTTAIKKANLEDTIHVKRMDESIFLLHKDRVTLVLEQAQAAESQNGNAPK